MIPFPKVALLINLLQRFTLSCVRGPGTFGDNPEAKRSARFGLGLPNVCGREPRVRERRRRELLRNFSLRRELGGRDSD
jgi:hypothetical protein